MKGRLARSRPSPGVVLGTLALIVALGGTAVALPGKRTVRADDLKKGSVTSWAIRANNVRSGDVVRCRRGTVFVNGLCFDAGARPAAATALVAADVCKSAGGRLPTALQLRSIRNVAGIDLGRASGTSGHYADAIHFVNGTLSTVAVGDGGAIDRIATGADRSFRCVYERIR